MKPELDEKLLIRYVLGETKEEEGQRLEDQYFTDDSCFEELAIVEEELIDAYVNRTLSSEQRKRFELHFLSSPERRQRVAFAQALLLTAENRQARHATADVTRGKPWSWLGGANRWRIPQPAIQGFALAGFVLLALLGSYSIIQNQSLRNQLAGIRAEGQNLRLQVEQQRTLDQQLSQLLEQERSARNQVEQTLQNQQARIASFFLTAGVVRGSADGHAMLIRRGTELVRLELETQAEDNLRYRVSVRTADDQEIWSQDGLTAQRIPSGASVGFTLPANILVPGDYAIMLRTITSTGDVEDAGQYAFRITNR